jgi:hypothetical protein
LKEKNTWRTDFKLLTAKNQIQQKVEKKITCDDCKKMIDKIPKKLNKVIKGGGEQIHMS